MRSLPLFVFATLASAASANLISNGGFESNTWGGTSYLAIGPGQTSLPAWSVSGTTVDIVGTDYSPRTGNFAVDLAGTPGPGAIGQSFATVSGESYTLSFWARSTMSGPLNAIVAKIGGTEVTFVPTGAWAQYTLSGTATSALTGIELGTTLDNTTNGNLFVDDVLVTPEPASMAVLGLGLAALKRRRRNG